MRKSKFTAKQIATILRSAEVKGGIAHAAKVNGISAATIYQWRAKYGRLTESEMQVARDNNLELTRLKHVYSELSRDHLVVKEVLEKMLSSVQRRHAVAWAVDVMHFSQRRACRLLMQNRGTQRRSLNKPDLAMERGLVVLIVEDYPDTRASVGTMVGDWEDAVLLKANGFLEAATVLNAADGVDLLICGASLAGEMTGIDVAEIAVKTFPDIAVVIFSEHAQADIPRFTERYTHVRRPFNREQLLDHIDNAHPGLIAYGLAHAEK